MEPNNSFSPGDEILGEDDCFSILQELEAVAHRWYDIGLALGLRTSALDGIKSKGQDVHELLRNMITEWLKMSYNVERFGPPSWRRIVEAVRDNSGGKNPAVADTLARKYSVTIQDTQPISNSTLTPSLRTDHIPLKEHSICCCLTVRISRNPSRSSSTKTSIGQDSFQLHPIPSNTTHGDSQRSRISSTHSSQKSTAKRSLSPTSPGRLDHHKRDKIKETSPFNMVPQAAIPRRLSHSLPSNPVKYYMHDESNLMDSQNGSRDIITAHPSWQIEEIAQQEGYWGAMTGAMAELKLRRHGGGNCYLIRYSERQSHFVVSVMRRNIQNMSQPKYHHFKLNVTKEDGYEIEGSEKKFKDISSLFKFYKTNPLTCTNCIIGKACSPPLPLQFIS